MAGLTTVLPYLSLAAQGASLVSNVFSNEASHRAQRRAQEQAVRQLQERQALQQRQAEAQAALEREQITEAARSHEEDRKAALRRAVARQRARFGSSGVGNALGGSASAVLLGLFDETEDELAERERLDNLRQRALDLSLSNRNSLNVLQRTQLQERQNIGRLSLGINRFSDLLDAGRDVFNFANSASTLF